MWHESCYTIYGDKDGSTSYGGNTFKCVLNTRKDPLRNKDCYSRSRVGKLWLTGLMQPPKRTHVARQILVNLKEKVAKQCQVIL